MAITVLILFPDYSLPIPSILTEINILKWLILAAATICNAPTAENGEGTDFYGHLQIFHPFIFASLKSFFPGLMQTAFPTMFNTGRSEMESP